MFDSITFFRVIKAGFVNFWRNISLSAAATMVMTITLVIFSVLVLLFGVTRYSVTAIRNRVDISVYFKPGVAETKVNQLRQDLKNNQKVGDVAYTSAEDALAIFKTKHANDSLILESLSELSDNPLPATLQIKAKNLEDYPTIAKFISDGAYKDSISKVNFEDNRLLIGRLSKLLKFIVTGGVALVVVFSLIAILVIYNTITLTIYNRREEVEIMRLVGATNWYIRGPFLVEALLYSFVATLITSVILFVLLSRLLPYLRTLFGTDLQLPQTYFNAPLLSLCLLVVALFLSTTSSTLAIRKYLKV